MKTKLTIFESVLLYALILAMVYQVSFCWESGKLKAQIKQNKIVRVISLENGSEMRVEIIVPKGQTDIKAVK